MEITTAAGDIAPGLRNSLIIGIGVVLLNMILGIPAAYAFARFRYRVIFFFFLFLLFCRMVPAVAISIPFYLIMKELYLLDTVFVVILAHLSFTLPFTVWILRAYFITIPKDMEESARIDGCTRIGSLIRVVLPLSLPGLASAIILSFMFSWNEFLFALILTSTSASKTMPVIAALIASDLMIKYGVINATGVITVIPAVVFTLAFAKCLRRGLTMGAIK